MVLLESQMHFCRIQRVGRRLHCLWHCSLYEKGGSAHGFPLLIFPMIPCLTLRGLDSALPLAEPNYSPVSIALFDSSRGVLSCLRVCSRVPHVCGTLHPPHHPPTNTTTAARPAKTQSLLWLRRRVSAPPFAEDNQDKSKKKKKKDRRKLRCRVDPVLVCLSDSTIYGWAWDTAGAKLTVYTERVVPKNTPSYRQAGKNASRESLKEREREVGR